MRYALHLVNRALALFAFAFVAALLVTHNAGCASWQQVARTVLDASQVACIIANQTLGDADVAKACEIADDLRGPMQDVLASARKASADAQRAGSSWCIDEATDGGTAEGTELRFQIQ